MSDDSFLVGDAGNQEAAVSQSLPADSPGWVSALSDDYKGMIETKGWKEPADVLKSYKDLESFMGADKAGRGMVLPKDENDVEGFSKIYSALGRPESPEDYDLMSQIGNAEYDKGMLDKVSQAMHTAGLNTKQAHAVVNAYQQEYAAMQEGMKQHFIDEQNEVKATLSSEKLEMVRRGFRHLELPAEKAVEIEAYLGPKMAAEVFGKIGKLLGEDQAPRVGSQGHLNFSSEGATTRRENLLSDKLFLQRYMNGEASALNEIETLNRQIAKANERAE